MKTSIQRGVQGIAVFEAAKGLLVLVAGLGLLRYMHADWQEIGDRIVEHLHLDPDHHAPQVFLQAMDRMSPTRIRWLALGAAVYAAFRLAEAYGLWFGRRWGAWIAVISGGLYLPFELYHLVRGFSAGKLVLTLLNIALVIYLWKFRHEDGLEVRPKGHIVGDSLS